MLVKQPKSKGVCQIFISLKIVLKTKIFFHLRFLHNNYWYKKKMFLLLLHMVQLDLKRL